MNYFKKFGILLLWTALIHGAASAPVSGLSPYMPAVLQIKKLKLNEDRIERHSQLIKKQMQRNYYARIACTTGAIALGAAAGWWIWSGREAKVVQECGTREIIANTDRKTDQLIKGNEKVKADLNILVAKLQSLDASELQRLKDENVQLKKQIEKPWWQPSFSFFSGASLLGGYITFLLDRALGGFVSAQLAGVTLTALSPVFKAWDSVFYPQSITWFAEHKTHIRRLVGPLSAKYQADEGATGITTFAQQLLTSTTERERQVLVDCISQNLTMLMIEFEKLIGYMDYKYNTCKTQFPLSSNGMKMITKNITTDISLFIESVQEVIADESRHNELEKLVHKFVRQLNSYKHAFALYEDCSEDVLI